MPRYIVERNIPDAAELSEDALDRMREQLENTLANAGGEVQWLQSFVLNHKMYCVYLAPDETMVRNISDVCGFPTSTVSLISAILTPKTTK